MDRERERERDTLSCFMIGIFTAVGLIVWVGGLSGGRSKMEKEFLVNFWERFLLRLVNIFIGI